MSATNEDNNANTTVEEIQDEPEDLTKLNAIQNR